MSTTPSRYAQAMADPSRPMCPNGCPRRIWAGGVCAVCYRMIRLYGVAKTGWRDPAEILRRRTEFFWANLDKRGPDECWPWLRKPNDMGYGQLRWVSRTLQAHRVAYLLEHGELPDGMEIDHTCHDPLQCTRKRQCSHRLCCNPAHLEAVTKPVNLERSNRTRPGNGKNQERTKCPDGCTCRRHEDQTCKPDCTCRRHKDGQTHCVNGHEYTPETTAVDPKTGWRHCRTCKNEQRRVPNPPAKSRVCPPGCTCGRHRPRR